MKNILRGLICYYSGSGNTKLACQYLIKRIRNAKFELYNIVKNDIPDFSKYDIAGFATFTDFGGVPQYFCSFFDKLAPQINKNAFVFNTYGAMSLKTLKMFSEIAQAKGFNVFSGHSLHTPDNYPPMRKRGKGADQSPTAKDLQKFDEFILRLDNNLKLIESRQEPVKEKIKIGLVGTLIPAYSRTKAKSDFGLQQVNETVCIECGTCEKGCPYEAIKLDPKPVFDHSKCYGCWYCYNHCPKQAIITKKFHGEHQYPKPSPDLVKRLS